MEQFFTFITEFFTKIYDLVIDILTKAGVLAAE